MGAGYAIGKFICNEPPFYKEGNDIQVAAAIGAMTVRQNITAAGTGTINLVGDAVNISGDDTTVAVTTATGAITIDARANAFTIDDDINNATVSTTNAAITITADAYVTDANAGAAQKITAGTNNNITIQESTAATTIGLGGAVVSQTVLRGFGRAID